MSIDQAKLDRIKASLGRDAKAEGVTPGPWAKDDEANDHCMVTAGKDAHGAFIYPADCCMSDNAEADSAFIARARTTAPAMAELLLDEILWLEQTWNSHCYNRLARIVNGWPETL